MLVSGFVAFLLYRFLKESVAFSNPLILLGGSGSIALMASLWAYRMGRESTFPAMWREDGIIRLAWVGGWIGGVYAMQLALLVLALLAIFVQYNFLVHPEGPAMMALIIASTAVARDAFELGCVRRLECAGHSFVRMPTGRGFRQFLRETSPLLRRQGLVVLAIGLSVISMLLWLEVYNNNMLIHVMLVGVWGAVLAHVAYFKMRSDAGHWWHALRASGWWQGLKFWLWPCLTFTLTYYLIQAGVVLFLAGADLTHPGIQLALAGATMALMISYSAYLGSRTLAEWQSRQGVSENLSRCPFVSSLLRTMRSKSGEADALAESANATSTHTS
ncbi:MAG: hypothetical protein D6704_07195 [Nitrospirae bacterium]|nr:MAG: hypothetical protein D6704_07195 [Nitrospirota bacterium]